MQVSSACNKTEFNYEIKIKHFEYAPIRKGDVVGKVQVKLGDRVVAESSVIANNSVECITVESANNPGLLSRIKKFFKSLYYKITGMFTER